MSTNLINSGTGGRTNLINTGIGGSISFIKLPPPSLVKNGLVVQLETANASSYPGSGTTWYDISGNGYNASMTNGTVGYTAGSPGYFSFASTNPPYFLGNSTLADPIIPGTGGITIVSVVSITDLSQRSLLFSKYIYPAVLNSVPSGYDFEVGTLSGLWTNTGRWFLQGSNTNAGIDRRGNTSPFSQNQIYLIACTYDRPTSTAVMYYNNSVLSTNDGSGNQSGIDTLWPNGAYGYAIGTVGPAWDGATYGYVGAFMHMYATFVYNRALSLSEIQQNYTYLKLIYGIS
jgi:hypothetical protein